MKIKAISQVLEKWAPPQLAESYDNVGLLLGDPEQEIDSALITLDITEEVLKEAEAKEAGLIIAHHPIWFSSRKKLTTEDYIGRTLLRAAQKNIGIYACHTNLDNVSHGVNHMIGEKLGLTNMRILSPKPGTLYKLETYVPASQYEAVLEALWEAGAGQIGNYREASFSTSGTGTFRPVEGASPAIGAVGQREAVEEIKVELILPGYLRHTVIHALHQAHPYETPAWQLFTLKNSISEIGSGMIGELRTPLSKTALLEKVKSTFKCGGIRYADAPIEQVKRIAFCGGSGSFLISNALKAQADAFITADISYHKFFDAEGKMLLLDIGHYESEQFTSELIYRHLSKTFPKFAVQLSNVITNPIKYF